MEGGGVKVPLTAPGRTLPPSPPRGSLGAASAAERRRSQRPDGCVRTGGVAVAKQGRRRGARTALRGPAGRGEEPRAAGSSIPHRLPRARSTVGSRSPRGNHHRHLCHRYHRHGQVQRLPELGRGAGGGGVRDPQAVADYRQLPRPHASPRRTLCTCRQDVCTGGGVFAEVSRGPESTGKLPPARAGAGSRGTPHPRLRSRRWGGWRRGGNRQPPAPLAPGPLPAALPGSARCTGTRPALCCRYRPRGCGRGAGLGGRTALRRGRTRDGRSARSGRATRPGHCWPILSCYLFSCLFYRRLPMAEAARFIWR